MVTDDPAFEADCHVFPKSPCREWYEVFFELKLWGFGLWGRLILGILFPLQIQRLFFTLV